MLLFTASDFTFTTRHILSWASFLLWLSRFFPSGAFFPLFSYWPRGLIFQWHIFLLFHTVSYCSWALGEEGNWDPRRLRCLCAAPIWGPQLQAQNLLLSGSPVPSTLSPLGGNSQAWYNPAWHWTWMVTALSEALFPLDLRDASLLVRHLPGQPLLPSACGLTSPPHLSTLDHPRANTVLLSP